MRRLSTKIFSVLLSLTLLLAYTPIQGFAADDADLGSVHVLVENTTFTKASADSGNKAPAWSGELVDTYIDLKSDSTMMSCVLDAVADYSDNDASETYIKTIHGLSQMDGGSQSGWMGTLNDWFTSQSFSAYTVEKGTLSDGDEIRVVYSLNYGVDCGGSWDNNDKSVKSVAFMAKGSGDDLSAVGKLDRNFSKSDTNDYTLYLPKDVKSIYVVPIASNKNFQVRASLDSKEYKRTQGIDVQEGSVISVTCGDPAWPTMNSAADVPAKTYRFKVTYQEPIADPYIVLPEAGCYTADDGKIYLTGKQNDTVQLSLAGVEEGTTVAWKSSSSTNASIGASTGLMTFKKNFTSASAVKITASVGGKAVATADLNLIEAFRTTTAPSTTLAVPESNLKTTSTKMNVTASLGLAPGLVTWDIQGQDKVNVVTDLSAPRSSVEIQARRPGKVTISALFNKDHSFDQVKEVNITGVAVETANGGQPRLAISSSAPNPTCQLAAYVEESASVKSWKSSDEAVATVDENGLVTAKSAGRVTITATDSNDKSGNFVMDVIEEGKPYFDSLELLTTSFNTGEWVAGETYVPTKLSYDLSFKSATTANLTFQAATKYDAEKYVAEAVWVNSDGESSTAVINSGKLTTLEKMAFDQCPVTVTLKEIANPENKTVYIFNIARPRDTAKAIKATSGIVFAPEGRVASQNMYKSKAEGTMFQADDKGVATATSGVSSTKYNYRAYALEALDSFTLNLTGSTAYSHIRYSCDDGATWSADGQNLVTASGLKFPEGNVAKVLIQVLDDATYHANAVAGKDGFADATPAVYTVWVELFDMSNLDNKILTASVENGEFYPAFDPAVKSYTVMVPNGTTTANLSYTVSDGCTVKVGTATQKAADGTYTLALTTTSKKVDVSTADGATNSYNFKIKARSAKDYADSVVDYLPINSQFFKGSRDEYNDPTEAMRGGLATLGNFGGYITYYFKKPLVDDPKNKYGMDFYAYGNSFIEDGTDSSQTPAENGQVWVSEDGKAWYALAGSEHYEDDILWDYAVTYKKTATGSTEWTDNQGNSDSSSRNGDWVNPNKYYLSPLAKESQITLTGICMPSSLGTITGDGTNASKAHAVSFGYVDYYPNGDVGADVNPYAAKPEKANGFDLEWAVDAEGKSIDVSGKEFHYVKVVTANNIYAGSFGEKSTETTGVLRTTAQESEVGKTKAPVVRVDGVAVSGTEPVFVSDSFEVTVKAEDGANVYINNQRTDSASFAALPRHKVVRVIAQKGDAEPSIVTFEVKSAADDPAGAVIQQIHALGEITLDSKVAVEKVRAAYDALTDEQKAQIPESDLLILQKAEVALMKIDAEELMAQAQDAMQVAKAAQAQVDADKLAVEAAQNNAEAAQKAADEAQAEADAAQKVADDAMKAAEEAQAKADADEKSAQEAKAAADAAQAKADATQAAADAAQAKADAAQAAVDAAQVKVNEAQKAAEAAQAAADEAMSAAKAAQAKVDAEKADVEAAKKAVEEAKAEAEAAQKAAKEAQAKADADKKALKDAQAKADDALKKAKEIQAFVKKSAKVKKLTAKKKAAKASVKKVKGATGYQIRYSTKSSMKKAKKVTTSKLTKKIKKLKKGKKYYVQVRAYKVIDGEKYYTAYSAMKAVKIKK